MNGSILRICSTLHISVLGLTLSCQSIENSNPYEDLNTYIYLGEAEVVARIQGESIFTKGPAVDLNGNVYFTNIPASEILKWDQGMQTVAGKA